MEKIPTYSLPIGDALNTSAGFLNILIYINNATLGWLSRLLLIGLYVIVLMGYYNTTKDFVGGIAIAGFSTFIIGFLLFISGFVNGLDLGFAVGIMILGVAWILIDKQGTA